jgi:hypothetical protein
MLSIARLSLGLILVGFVAHGAPVSAETFSSRPYDSLFIHTPPGAIETPPAVTRPPGRVLEPIDTAVPVDAKAGGASGDRRGGPAFAAMYAGLVTVQALDAHSTLRAIDLGLREANPLMRWASGSPVAFVALKASATAATVFVTEKIRRKHPTRALVFVGAINAAYALIVAHNYRVLSGAR